LAENTQPTNTIYYSLDEGDTLTPFQFTDSVQVNIDNIMISTGGTGRKFIIIGRTTTGSPVIFSLDLTPLQPRVCLPSDYERWTPSDGSGGPGCVLGRSNTYLRRRRDAACYNNLDDHLVGHVDCACVVDDWECDFGYEATSATNNSLVCALTGELAPDPPTPCPSGTAYNVSKGYRKIAGDSCVGGLNLSPSTKNCPNSGSIIPGGKAWIAVLVIVLLVAAIGIGAFFGYRNEAVRTKVSEYVSPVLAKIKSITSSSDQRYSRVGVRPGSLADEEFGIGGDGDGDLEDDSLEDEEGAKELGDNDITDGSHGSEFDPRK